MLPEGGGEGEEDLTHVVTYVFPDSIPPSDRHWPNVSTSVGPMLAADVGPTAF